MYYYISIFYTLHPTLRKEVHFSTTFIAFHHATFVKQMAPALQTILQWECFCVGVWEVQAVDLEGGSTAEVLIRNG